MPGRLSQCWSLIAAHPRPLLAVVLGLYGPLYGMDALSVSMGWLPADAADKLFGLIGVLIMPLVNAAIVWLAHNWRSGHALPLSDALLMGRKSWSRLLTAYVSVSFILLGWLAVAIVPLYALMMILKLQQPLLLAPPGLAAAIFVMSRYAFLDALVVVEGLGAYEARQKSAELAKGHRLRLIGWGLLVFGPPFALETGGDFLAEYLKPDVSGGLPLLIATLTGFGASFLYVVPTIYFYLYYRELGGTPA